MQRIELKLSTVSGKLNNDSSNFTNNDTHQKTIEVITKVNNLYQIFNPALFW